MSSEDEKTEMYIIKGLLSFSDYAAKYLEKIQPDHFSPELSPVIKILKRFHDKYHKMPTLEILCDKLLPKVFRNDEEKIEVAEDKLHTAFNLKVDRSEFYEWLSDETKEFITNRSMRDALIQAVEYVQNGNVDAAVKIVQEAGSVVFDDDIGLDYWDDLEKRVERMKLGEHTIPTGISLLDKKIGGGWHNKSLNIFGAATNVGKTLIMSDVSAKLIRQGYDGLYVTLEIYEDLLANRVDANLADIELSNLPDDPDFLMKTLLNMKKEAESKGHPFGRFIIKEFAPNCLTSNGLIALVRELELKRGGFKPEFICIDYIGLMAPNMRVKGEGTYGNLKRVAEELRAAASILDVPVFSATQVNRDGYNTSHVGLENTSDSMGIPMTADLMIMVTRDENMEAENKMWWHIAKSRFSRNGDGFPMNVEYPFMRITCDEDSRENKELVIAAKRAKQAALTPPETKSESSVDDENHNEGKKDAVKKKKINL